MCVCVCEECVCVSVCVRGGRDTRGGREDPPLPPPPPPPPPKTPQKRGTRSHARLNQYKHSKTLTPGEKHS